MDLLITHLGGNNDDWRGAALCTVGILVLLAAVTGIAAVLGLTSEASRKMVHIAVGHYILLAFALIQHRNAVILPLLLFVILNALSLKTKLFAAMETKDRNTWGTVYYPAALAVCVYLWWDNDKTALAVAAMALAWGDGMAAAVGSRAIAAGTAIVYQNAWGNKRSVQGTLAHVMFATLGIAAALLLTFDHQRLVAESPLRTHFPSNVGLLADLVQQILGVKHAELAVSALSALSFAAPLGVLSAAVEACAWGDTDNVSIPLAVGFAWHTYASSSARKFLPAA